MKNVIVFATLLSLLVGIRSTHADFVILDADFETATRNQPLGRQGAEFGEPVTGQFDTSTDLVVRDFSTSDWEVQITDSSPNPTVRDQLYWKFTQNRVVDDGVLTLSCEIQPIFLLDGLLLILSEDMQSFVFFNLLINENGTVQWLDTNSTIPTTLFTYIPGQEIQTTVCYYLETGLYDLEVNGTTYLVGESSGVPTGVGIGGMIVGHAADSDQGEWMRVDDFLVTHDPGASATVLLETDFNSMPLGPIGQNGAERGEPVLIGGVGMADVVSGSSKKLRICDSGSFGSGQVRYEFLGRPEIDDGEICATLTVVNEDLFRAGIRFREQGTSASSFLTFDLMEDGVTIRASNADGQVALIPYVKGVPVELRTTWQMDTGLFYMWVDDVLIAKKESHGITNRGLGAIIFNTLGDDVDNCFTVDDIRVVYSGPTQVTPTPFGPNVVADLGDAELTFAAVTAEGTSVLQIEDSGPASPGGFQVIPATDPIYYDLSTTATYSGQITVCINYDDADVSGNEAALRLFHYEGSSWEDITVHIDTGNNVICGETTSLSPFIIAEPTLVSAPDPVAQPIRLTASPNPFVSSTRLRFALPEGDPGQILIFDPMGRVVRDLSHEVARGATSLVWDGRDGAGLRVSSGVYYIRFGTSASRALPVIKIR